MAIRPNWGKGRNLRIKIFEEAGHTACETAVNAWLQALEEEQILDIQLWIEVYGSPAAEYYHVQILYTLE